MTCHQKLVQHMRWIRWSLPRIPALIGDARNKRLLEYGNLCYSKDWSFGLVERAQITIWKRFLTEENQWPQMHWWVKHYWSQALLKYNRKHTNVSIADVKTNLRSLGTWEKSMYIIPGCLRLPTGLWLLAVAIAFPIGCVHLYLTPCALLYGRKQQQKSYTCCLLNHLPFGYIPL